MKVWVHCGLFKILRKDGMGQIIQLGTNFPAQEGERINSSALLQREINLCLSFSRNGQQPPGPSDL